MVPPGHEPASIVAYPIGRSLPTVCQGLLRSGWNSESVRTGVRDLALAAEREPVVGDRVVPPLRGLDPDDLPRRRHAGHARSAGDRGGRSKRRVSPAGGLFLAARHVLARRGGLTPVG